MNDFPWRRRVLVTSVIFGLLSLVLSANGSARNPVDGKAAGNGLPVARA